MDKSLFKVISDHYADTLGQFIKDNLCGHAIMLMIIEKKDGKIPERKSFNDVPLFHYKHILSTIDLQLITMITARDCEHKLNIKLPTPHAFLESFIKQTLQNSLGKYAEIVRQHLTILEKPSYFNS
jgi:hypothetical protein